ncbi:uncharacterized protein LOC107271851 [Cephus cinctus]|uniref:Uncharacterized protein LOC107271851 n=1 Tax=Cephus cinctus TaxID=211228 RepID=A0AAJ7C7G3_CEPCN|nr:uncharacterized protein LOC107271851 [Cephus cinctus]
MFPLEIWEFILQYCDPIDLIKYRRVCKSWNYLISRLLQTPGIWFNKCYKEIPFHIWQTILEKIYPDRIFKNMTYPSIASDVLYAECNFWDRTTGPIPRNWKEDELLIDYQVIANVVRSWYSWRRIECIIPHVHKLRVPWTKIPSRKITCLACTGSILAIGTSESEICIHDFVHAAGPPIVLINPTGPLRDIKILMRENIPQLLTRSNNDDVALLNLEESNAYRKLKGTIMSTFYGRYSVCNGKYIYYEHADGSTNYESILLPYDDQFVAMEIDMLKLTVLSAKGSIYLLKNNLCLSTYVRPPQEKIRNYFMFKSNVIICITFSGYLGISVNSKPWTLFNVFRCLGGQPTAVHFYSQLLILGLDTGEVHLYKVHTPKDLEFMNFDIPSSHKLVLDTEAIISVDVMDVAHNHVIFAATSQSTYFIQFK